MMASSKLVILGVLALLSAVNAIPVDAVLDDFRMNVSGDSCKDCTQILELLMDLISDAGVQAKIKTSLEHACDLLPGPTRDVCHSQVDKNLAMVIAFITGIVKPQEICTSLGLCHGLFDGKDFAPLIGQFYKALRSAPKEVDSTPLCGVCLQLMKTVEYILPKEQTEAAIKELLGVMCSKLPTLLRGQCEQIISRYIKMLLDVVLNPSSVCSLLHLCDDPDMPISVTPTLSDCDSCLILAVLTRLQLGTNATDLQTTSFLSSVCKLHPSALPKCEGFTRRHYGQLRGFLGKEGPVLDMCQTVDLCAAPKEKPVAVGDPCSLGINYRCRDLNIARACGVVSFCQKYVWK